MSILDNLPSLPFVSAYSPKHRSSLVFDPRKDRTKQSFKDECDINNIMRRYAATGQVDHVSARTPLYGEIPALDFQAAMALVVEAREQFALLSSEVRDRFSNDPARLLGFLEDPANRAEGERLGLLKAAEPGVATPLATPPAAASVAASGASGAPAA